LPLSNTFRKDTALARAHPENMIAPDNKLA